MIWLRLIWWVLWRAVICGALVGVLIGTLILPLIGTVMGLIFGTLFGLALGLLNGISMTIMAFNSLNPPYNRSRAVLWILVLVIPVDVSVMMSVFGSEFSIIPSLMLTLIVIYFSFGFVKFADAQLALVASRKQETDDQPLTNNYTLPSLMTLGLLALSAYGITGSLNDAARLPDRYLIPAGYTGWITVKYRVANEPPLPIEDGHYLLVISMKGELSTSSDMDDGVSTSDDYYTYQADGTRTSLPKTDWGGGGMVWSRGTMNYGGNITGEGFENPTTIFFVGTEAQYHQK